MSQKLKILLVENHSDALTYLKKYLEEYGHEVIAVRNFQTALSYCRSINKTSSIDVFISDILLPDGNGLELLRHAQSHSPSVFSIAMSGLEEHCYKSIAAGYHHYLLKPFAPEHLEPLLQQALQFHKKNFFL